MNKATLILFTIVLAATVNAQEISGRVSDYITSEFLNDVKVEIVNNNSGESDSVFTDSFGNWSFLITDVNSTNLISSFELGNNYPNPFNPSTTITYEIPNQVENDFNFVRLKVYDVLGRIVSQLVNQEQKSGTYQVLFNAENLPSGIYFARLTVGTLSKTISMQLLK